MEETKKRDRRIKPTTKDVVTTFAMTHEDARKLNSFAKSRGMTKTEIIAAALNNYINEELAVDEESHKKIKIFSNVIFMPIKIYCDFMCIPQDRVKIDIDNGFLDTVMIAGEEMIVVNSDNKLTNIIFEFFQTKSQIKDLTNKIFHMNQEIEELKSKI